LIPRLLPYHLVAGDLVFSVISYRDIVVVHRVQYGERRKELIDERIDFDLRVFLGLETYARGLKKKKKTISSAEGASL
jgi:hypothetical protein